MNDKWQFYSLALFLSIISGGSGYMITTSNDKYRPDPFTGTEGRDLERRIGRLEEEHNEDYKRLRQDINKIGTEQSVRKTIVYDAAEHMKDDERHNQKGRNK